MIQVSQIIEGAKQATGLSNFGPDGWQEGLEILTDSVNREADLNEMGVASYIGQCTMFLMRRLEIEDWYTRHPEIDEQQIVAPLLVLGMPRTGSTALHCLLGEDPNVRVMRNWECMFPCPPPEAATYWTDPRIAMMEEQMQQREVLTPRMKQMLPSSATTPTEDQVTMGFDFKSQMFQSSFRIPTYTEWFNHKADLVPDHAVRQAGAEALQWRCPPTRWRLKNPTYMLLIDALDKVFPDARYVMTHRDVADVIPSVADLYFELSRNNTDRPDKHWMGAVMRECCALGLRRMIAFRDARQRTPLLRHPLRAVPEGPVPVARRALCLPRRGTDPGNPRAGNQVAGRAAARQARAARVRSGRVRARSRRAAAILQVLFGSLRRSGERQIA